MQVTRFQDIPGLLSATAKEVDFGARVTGVDLAALTEEQFVALEKALYTHLVLIIPGQGHLTGPQQLALTKRFDPAAGEYGHGSDMAKMRASVLQNDLTSLPSAPEVKLLGNGPVAEHDGLMDLVLKHPMHHTWHRDVLPADELSSTRFYRWHIDAALYEKNPPRVTTLLGLTVPEGAPQTVRYDDGSGDTLSVPLACTAFVSGEHAFQALSPEAKAFALAAKVRYHPHPYAWMRNAHSLPTGLGLHTEGLELSNAELPPWREEDVMVLPAVWKNRLTGKLALQMHPSAVEDFYLPTDAAGSVASKSQGSEVRLSDSGLLAARPEDTGIAPFASAAEDSTLGRVRRVVNALMRPSIAPSRILALQHQPGDMIIFANRAVLHTVTGTLKATDVRVYHQCNLAGSDRVVGPSADEVAALWAAEAPSTPEYPTMEASAAAFVRKAVAVPVVKPKAKNKKNKPNLSRKVAKINKQKDFEEDAHQADHRR